MILPANVSTIVHQQLTQPSDEHIGNVHQRHQAPRINTAQMEQGVASHVKESPLATGLQAAASLYVGSAASAVDLNLIPVVNNSLRTDSACLFGNRRPVDANRRYPLRDSGENSGDHHNGEHAQELVAAQLLEIEISKTVVETTLAIQKEGAFGSFLVALLYSKTRITQMSVKLSSRVMVVAPLDNVQTGFPTLDIPAHTTFVTGDSRVESSIANLPAQLVDGGHAHAADWMAIRCVRIYTQIEARSHLWRLQASAFQDNLGGAAMVVGDVSVFSGRQAQVSLHIPGSARVWRQGNARLNLLPE